MSQIGYMIMGVGTGAYGAGVLHFLTHAFFKAQLFLGAGIIIHQLHDEQDVRKMGGLRKQMPFAFVAMLLGVLAICGVPPFSGFFSKDAVLTGVLDRGHPVMWAVGCVTAGLTAYYMSRLLFVTFFGAYRGGVDPSELGMRHPELAGTSASAGHHPEEQAHGHEAHAPAWLMSGPVAVLMIPTVLIGFLAFGGENSAWTQFFDPMFSHDVPVSAALPEWVTSALVLVLVLAGFGVAFVRYGNPQALLDAIPRLRNETVRMPAILANAFYFDAAIDALFVKPSVALGRWFATVVDPRVIDAGVREASISASWLGHLFRSFETGLVRAYALTIAFGVACFAIYYAVVGAAR
jgi:NADH:ubiquinone oxidoreductase subunit 5 (subunit L)/multisubunit Na+/H+ antiporter MnhA subunit